MKEEEEILADALILERQSPAAVAADAAFRSDRKRLFDFIRRRPPPFVPAAVKKHLQTHAAGVGALPPQKT